MPSLVVNPPTPPAPVVTQPQVVLVKQFQPPKPYTGASWQGYREYFERLATVNGWSTTEQKTEQLALQRNQRQFQQRPTTPPMPARPRRGPGCYVCGDGRCHTEVHRRNGTLPPDFRRIPPTWNNERN